LWGKRNQDTGRIWLAQDNKWRVPANTAMIFRVSQISREFDKMWNFQFVKNCVPWIYTSRRTLWLSLSHTNNNLVIPRSFNEPCWQIIMPEHQILILM